MRGVIVDGVELIEAEMQIGEDEVPLSSIVGMPLRVRRLNALSSGEPYIISHFMGDPAHQGMSSEDWMFGGATGVVAPQTFVARSDGVPFLATHFDYCLDKLEGFDCGGDNVVDEAFDDSDVVDEAFDDSDVVDEAFDDSDVESATSDHVEAHNFGINAVREFRELISHDFLPSRKCDFAQNFGMASSDDTLNSFVFGLWKMTLTHDDKSWSTIAALESVSEVPALFERVYSVVARKSEENFQRKNLVRFVGG